MLAELWLRVSRPSWTMQVSSKQLVPQPSELLVVPLAASCKLQVPPENPAAPRFGVVCKGAITGQPLWAAPARPPTMDCLNSFLEPALAALALGTQHHHANRPCSHANTFTWSLMWQPPGRHKELLCGYVHMQCGHPRLHVKVHSCTRSCDRTVQRDADLLPGQVGRLACWAQIRLRCVKVSTQTRARVAPDHLSAGTQQKG